MAGALAALAADVTAAGVEVRLLEPSGELRVAARSGTLAHAALGSGVMLWCHAFGRPAGRGTETLPGAGISCLPIRQAGEPFGVLVVDFESPRDPTRDEAEVLSSAAGQAAARGARAGGGARHGAAAGGVQGAGRVRRARRLRLQVSVAC